MLILLFSIVRNVISVTSVKCQVLRMFSKCHENFPKIWKFSNILKIFRKSENFQTFWKFSENLKNFWKFSENLKIFRKSENFLKIWKFSENLKIVRKSENFPKIWKFSENLKMVRSCLLITLVTCLKGHKSLRVLFGSVFQQWQWLSEWVNEWVSEWVSEWQGNL